MIAAMTEPEINLDLPSVPHDWTPRHYQNDALDAFNRGLRRQIHIWHRRAGKDALGLNHAAIETQREVGNYWHLFPLQTQAKKAIWEGLDGDGKRIIDRVFPLELRSATLNTDMMLKFKCGSTWQMAGSDRYNALVGSNVRGVVFSEWALCNPLAWDYIRPILRENDGWVMFITTYRGKNHAHQMYEMLKDHPDWYCSKLDVDDTKRHDGTPVLSEADIEAERAEGMSEAMIQQEYYNSPEASHAGAYYGQQMFELNESNRRGAFGYDPTLPLYAAFDRSTASVLACVLVQPDGNMHNVIASKIWDNMTVNDSFAELREIFPFARKIEKAIMPPTANIEDMTAPGVEFETAPNEPLLEGIDIVRNYLPLTRIDVQIHPWAEEGNNIELISSLQGYRAEIDNAHTQMLKAIPEFVPEIYLASAFLNYCLFVHQGGIQSGWSDDMDYTLHDRAAGIAQGPQARAGAGRGYKRASSQISRHFP